MADFKGILSRFGFSSFLLVTGIILFFTALSGGQNGLVLAGIAAIVIGAILIILFNSGILKLNLLIVFLALVFAGVAFFAWLDYSSVQRKIDFVKVQDYRESKVVERLMDIRTAQVSYKKLYGQYAGNFDALINHVKNDSMPVVKAIGFVPDTLTEMKAVELGIVTRDTLLISVRDTLFKMDFPIDSLRYVPFSDGGEFKLESGEIEKNQLKVKVFEAFASNEKILHGLNLSEEYIDLEDGLRVGSMTEPHTRGNWE
ncbi:MAG: hypothetical protein RIC15_08755 [Vicingaceae bacterium]